jgi:short-subunit dehydrogenase
MNHQKKNIVIVGATSSIAEHCARLWANQYECDFSLIGRNLEKLKRIAADLEIRNPKSRAEVIQVDFIDSEKISTLARSISATAQIDIVLIAQGSLPDQKNCQSNLQLCEDTLSINGISPVLFAEAFANELEKSGSGTLAVISSVAGDRGRKSNYVYGAAKGHKCKNYFSETWPHRYTYDQSLKGSRDLFSFSQ